MRNLGLPEIIAIAAVAVLLFGGKWFSQFGKGMGEAIREWKRAMGDARETEKEIHK